MIQPTPGRVVWYYPDENSGMPQLGNDPLAAHIAAVHGDRLVNLMVIDATGNTHRKTSVVLVQEGDLPPKGAYCTWMPYQKAVAKGEISANIHAGDVKPIATALSFGDAIVALQQGKRVARWGWNGKGMFLFLVPGSTFTVNRAPLLGIYPEGTQIEYHAHIDMKTAQGYVVPWLASQADLLATDWEIVETA